MCADLLNLDSTDFGYVSNFMKPIPKMDSVRLFFQPLDCSDIAAKVLYGDDTAFVQNCVNLQAGDPKPEIRVANTYTYFNITNAAYFENIAFTGEDLFASLNSFDATG